MVSAPAPPAARSRPPARIPARPGGEGRTHPEGEAPTTIALALLTLASAFGLVRVFAGWSWVWPVAATAVVTHLALWAMRRRRVPPLLAAPASLLCVVLMVVWTVFGSSTFFGFPGAATWSHVSSAVGGIGPAFASSLAPVAPSSGFEMLAAAGAGLVAVLADWTAFRWRSPVLAMAPGVATFVACCAESQGPHRGLVVAVEVAAACAFLLVQRAAASSRQVWFAGVTSGLPRWWLTAGALSTALALVVTLAVLPALGGQDGHGVYGWRAGKSGNGVRIVPNPVVSLQTRLLQLGNTPVFTVKSTVASYWRLTSLDDFDGVNWKSTGAYRGFSTRLPGVAAIPPGTRTVTESFHVQDLDSVWLPDAFNPIAVHGIKGGVSYDPRSNSLLTSGHTSNGLDYTVVSYQYLSTLNSQALAAAPPVGNRPSLQPYLELPASVDSGPIARLASTITAGQSTEYGKAIAIQNYLRSPQFTYSLHPRMDGAGQAALFDFLFVTREGYCQQFAGAYAVLARAAGLPTRLAVGFTTGTAQPDGTFQVIDHDAHTWPEVYFGPRFGWLPFEPTPSFSAPGTSGYAGTGGASTNQSPAPITSVPQNPDATVPAISKNRATASGSAASPTTAARAGAGASTGPSWPLPLFGGLAGLVVVWALLYTGFRSAQRRWRRRAPAGGEAGRVRFAWDDLCADLEWYGMVRSRSETDAEFARRASDHLGKRGAPPWDHGGPTALARLAGEAAFARSLAPAAPAEARRAASEVRRWLARSARWRDRLARLVVPVSLRGRLQGLSPLPKRRRNRREMSSTA